MLQEDSSSVPSTEIELLTTTHNSRSKDPTFSSGLNGHPHICGIYSETCPHTRAHAHTKIESPLLTYKRGPCKANSDQHPPSQGVVVYLQRGWAVFGLRTLPYPLTPLPHPSACHVTVFCRLCWFPSLPHTLFHLPFTLTNMMLYLKLKQMPIPPTPFFLPIPTHATASLAFFRLIAQVILHNFAPAE